MASRTTDLQIRGIPVALRERLRRRAGRKGLSMSQYVIEILKDDLARPTVAEWAAEVGKLPPVDFGGKTSAELVRAGPRGLKVLDASVAVDMLGESPTGSTAAAMVASERLIVPAHFDAEVYAAFRRLFRRELVDHARLDFITSRLIALTAERV